MTDPFSLDTIKSEFNEETEMWVLQDTTSKKYVTIPHPKYPGRNPIHFFMRREDAEDVLKKILDVNWALRNRNISPTKVKLLRACRDIAADKTKGNADGFVVHPPNEVYEFFHQKKPVT